MWSRGILLGCPAAAPRARTPHRQRCRANDASSSPWRSQLPVVVRGHEGLGKKTARQKEKKKETKKEEQGKIEEFVDRCPGMKVEDKEKGWSAG